MLACIETARALPPTGLAHGMPRLEQRATEIEKIAVFGTDNRTALPKRLDKLRRSIGMIYNEQSRTVCSAFCVADEVIATASHCVFRTRGETPPPPERFYFSRPGTSLESVRFAGATSRSSAQQIVAGAIGISTKPPIEAARDWALVRLQSPACRGHALPVAQATPEDIEVEANAGRLYQVAFHRDFGRWSIAYSEPCFGGRRGEPGAAPSRVNDRDFTDPLNLVFHTCDTGGASSGSPLLIETPDGPRVVAINVGTFVHARVMVEKGRTAKREQTSPVANTGVASVAFAGKIDAIRRASVLTSASDLRALQQKLASAQAYSGPVNGRFDMGLRRAIEHFEERRGLPVLGLPTQQLLDEMTRVSAGR